jgi:tetratricopeptide (TPR) repeat protein/tRNA A-37 threonylcarbamoyl transferase component Bud32
VPTRDPQTPAETVADPVAEPRSSVLANLRGTIGRYTVLGPLGSGGMGTVLAAYDPQLDRRIALKLLHGRDDPGSGKQSTAHARLLREAQALAKVSHPNVIHVYDVGTVEVNGETTVFVAMEVVEGRTLRKWMEDLHATKVWRRGESWREIVQIMLQAARGLAAAHAAGLVHRDFKPDNVLIGDDGIVRVVDFGLARRVDDPRQATDVALDRALDSALAERLTITGAVLGTPAYMAPEQFRSGPIDGRTDQFAFCLTLYELLFGVRPFESSGSHGLAISVMAGELRRRPTEPPVPDHVVRVAERGLAPAPGDRFASMDAIIEALAHDPELARAQTRRRVVLGATATLAVVAAIWATARAGHPVDAPPDPCALGEARIAEVWNEERAQAMRATIDVEGPAYVARTMDASIDALHGYAEAWAAGYRDACEATHVRKTQTEIMLERRHACLDRRRAALEASAAELSTPGAPIEHALRVATGLPQVSDCADLAALQADVAPPADADTASAVAEIREALEMVDVRLRLSRHGDALALARELHAKADALGYAPLSAETAYAIAKALVVSEDHAAAVTAHRDAIVRAQAVGLDAIVRDAASGLSSVLGTDLARPEDGLLWADLAEATAERIGWTPKQRAELLRARAFILVEWRHDKDAVDVVERAHEAALEAYGPGAFEMIGVYSSLGSVYGRLQDFASAERAFRQAVELGAALVGPDHPSMINSYRNLGNVLSAQRKNEEARVNLEKALELGEALPSVPADDKATILNSLGNLLSNEERHEEAREMLGRALKLREEVYGPDHPIVARTLNSLGNVALHMGRMDVAQAEYERSLQIRERALGPEHPDLLTALNNLGSLLVRRERFDEAIAYFRRADAILVAHPGDAVAEADHRYWYGRALVESRRDPERGEALVDAAIAQLRETGREGFLRDVEAWRAEHHRSGTSG